MIRGNKVLCDICNKLLKHYGIDDEKDSKYYKVHNYNTLTLQICNNSIHCIRRNDFYGYAHTELMHEFIKKYKIITKINIIFN